MWPDCWAPTTRRGEGGPEQGFRTKVRRARQPPRKTPCYCWVLGGFWAFLGCTCLWHMEVPRLGAKLELQLPAYATATATATADPSCVCNLHHSSRNTGSLTH